MVLPLSAEALSFLGDTLWTLPIVPGEGPALVQQLTRARQRLSAAPFDGNAALVVARSTADIGRLREAVGLYTKAADLHPADPRVRRYRGEILLQLRELDLAQRDLQTAAQQLLGRPPQPEFVPIGQGGLLGSTLRFNTVYLLGLIYYLKGEFENARVTLAQAAKEATTGDDVIAAGLWLYFATRRSGASGAARRLLGMLVDSAAVSAREPELLLLSAFRGDVPYDSLGLDLHAPVVAERDALLGYGVGFSLLMQGRRDEADLAFERVRTYRDWTALPVLAAEADLARLRGLTRKEER